jgi:phospholipase/carboxylesterase
VLLHGLGGNETSLSGLASMLPADIAVALVRSPIALGPGSFGTFMVDFTSNGPVIDTEAAESSRRSLAAFIDELQERTGIAPERTLVAGFSQGGIMSAGLALTRPNLVAGFAILSGRILPEIGPLIAAREDLAHLDALVLHGESDSTLPVIWAERSAELLQSLGLHFAQRRYDARHEITREMSTDFVDWVRAKLSSHATLRP